MRITIILICCYLSGLARGEWEPCGTPSGCFCSRPVLHQIHCRNITIFPVFDDVTTPGVLSVSVRDSSMTAIPSFPKNQWDRLRDVSFRECPSLSCESINELRRPDLHIHSDCLCAECLTKCTTSGKNTICLVFLILSLTITIAGFGTYALLRWRRTSAPPCLRNT